MSHRLQVTHLPPSATNESLRERFEIYGDILSTNVLMDRETGNNRGMGFVDFVEAEEANTAQIEQDHSVWDGHAIRVAIHTEDRPPRRGSW